jgi:hypothetical protein
MPPTFHLASPNELDVLYEAPAFQSKLANCRELRASLPQGAFHETFCCKKEAILLFENDTDDEVALIIEQVPKDTSKPVARFILRLRIGDDIYDRKLP